jgi:tubulin polyglutamylase TTLL9
MKPIGSAQGKGIFLFTRLAEISDWKTDFKAYKPAPTAPKGLGLAAGAGAGAGVGDDGKGDVEAYVVQRYLQYPLLVGGKKFDMRYDTQRVVEYPQQKIDNQHGKRANG